MNAAAAVEVVGRATRSRIERVGDVAAFVADTARAARDVRTWGPEVTPQARRLGVDSSEVRANPKKFFNLRVF